MISVTQKTPSPTTTKLTFFFTISKDEWNTRENTGKSLNSALSLLWYAKRHLLGWSDVKQQKIKSKALTIIELRLQLSEGISQSVTRLVNHYKIPLNKKLNSIAIFWKHFQGLVLPSNTAPLSEKIEAGFG